MVLANVQPKAIIGAGNLHTPEEPVQHDFSSAKDDMNGTKLAPIQFASPPVSPADKTLASFSSFQAGLNNTLADLSLFQANLFPSHDATLYPNPNCVDPQYPLFRSAEEPLPEQDQRRPSTAASRAVHLGIERIGTVAHPVIYRSSPKKGDYYVKCLAELDHIKATKRALPTPSKSTAWPRDPETERQLNVLGRSAGGAEPTAVTKHKASRRASRKALPPCSPSLKTAMPIKGLTPAKLAPSSRRMSKPKETINIKDFEDRAFPSSAQQTKHKRAPPTKKVSKDNDGKWREILDFCPPLTSLATASKPLKVQWKGSPLDITGQADYAELDAQEADLATELRLLPTQYLANKRRMFSAKVEYIRMGKSFTKTAAQTVTNIDVNKTSKLWEAFDRVGWWDEKWFIRWASEPMVTETGEQ